MRPVAEVQTKEDLYEIIAAKDAEIAELQKKVASLHESLKLGSEAHDTYVRLTNPMDGLARELKLERERDEALATVKRLDEQVQQFRKAFFNV